MSPAKKVNSFESLTAEQRAAIAEKIFAPAREKKALFEAPTFKTLMQTFKDIVAREEVIDQETVKYAKDGRYPFTAEEFRMAFEAVMDHAPGEELFSRTEDGDFPILTKSYEGMEFSVLLGQGSTYYISAKEKDAPQP